GLAGGPGWGSWFCCRTAAAGVRSSAGAGWSAHASALLGDRVLGVGCWPAVTAPAVLAALTGVVGSFFFAPPGRLGGRATAGRSPGVAGQRPAPAPAAPPRRSPGQPRPSPGVAGPPAAAPTAP